MTAPIPQAAQPWRFEYNPEGDEWLLYTPEYEPEISFRVTRSHEFENRLFFARWKDSTMPREVAEVLAQSVQTSQLFAMADRGTREVIIVPDEILRAAENVRRLWDMLKPENKPHSHFMGV